MNKRRIFESSIITGIIGMMIYGIFCLMDAFFGLFRINILKALMGGFIFGFILGFILFLIEGKEKAK